MTPDPGDAIALVILMMAALVCLIIAGPDRVADFLGEVFDALGAAFGRLGRGIRRVVVTTARWVRARLRRQPDDELIAEVDIPAPVQRRYMHVIPTDEPKEQPDGTWSTGFAVVSPDTPGAFAMVIDTSDLSLAAGQPAQPGPRPASPWEAVGVTSLNTTFFQDDDDNDIGRSWESSVVRRGTPIPSIGVVMEDPAARRTPVDIQASIWQIAPLDPIRPEPKEATVPKKKPTRKQLKQDLASAHLSFDNLRRETGQREMRVQLAHERQVEELNKQIKGERDANRGDREHAQLHRQQLERELAERDEQLDKLKAIVGPIVAFDTQFGPNAAERFQLAVGKLSLIRFELGLADEPIDYRGRDANG